AAVRGGRGPGTGEAADGGVARDANRRDRPGRRRRIAAARARGGDHAAGHLFHEAAGQRDRGRAGGVAIAAESPSPAPRERVAEAKPRPGEGIAALKTLTRLTLAGSPPSPAVRERALPATRLPHRLASNAPGRVGHVQREERPMRGIFANRWWIVFATVCGLIVGGGAVN